MKIKKTFLIVAFSIFFASASLAAPSKPSKPAETDETKLFAQGTEKLMQENYRSAEKDLRAAISANDDYAEAHNNLAFVLRKQGEAHYKKALKHYNRAIKLNAKLAEAYMYRGVLHFAMGNKDLALADHEKLLKLGKNKLAAELEWVIRNGKEKEPAQFFGVVAVD